ncbi:hypothetical protein B0T25DRAFT_366210 [Lasiosphaeria hispida]|uniref:Uncharacterized protein n=1 Tax=Lasiosphaeria hispida TaxID=260671 RepID=A0AAJ0H5F9_9PEZI|nr:hypothetical protein B0T25DRAFT_366210 [Lasiosphaeria hispida]
MASGIGDQSQSPCAVVTGSLAGSYRREKHVPELPDMLYRKPFPSRLDSTAQRKQPRRTHVTVFGRIAIVVRLRDAMLLPRNLEDRRISKGEYSCFTRAAPTQLSRRTPICVAQYEVPNNAMRDSPAQSKPPSLTSSRRLTAAARYCAPPGTWPARVDHEAALQPTTRHAGFVQAHGRARLCTSTYEYSSPQTCNLDWHASGRYCCCHHLVAHLLLHGPAPAASECLSGSLFACQDDKISFRANRQWPTRTSSPRNVFVPNL